ncbi:MAG: HypC/HybG/HupF family hydrogenase formation chaperone [Myxococcota bacterium]
MCLAVPMKVVRVEGDRATAIIDQVEREIGTALVPDVAVGDYVIVHAGFAIQKLSESEAQETLELFRQMAALEAEAETG